VQGQPWLDALDPALCGAVLQAVASGTDATPLLNAALAGKVNAQGLPLRCVPQHSLPAGMAYEQFIYDTGTIPTRTLAGSKGAMHDACNALIWAHYPRSKAQLNALQATAIRADGIQGTRGRLRDALTLFDESALILCCAAADAAPAQLAQRNWQALLVERRSEWHRSLRPLLFGHAVMQKLQAPYPAITAQVWVLHTEAPDLPSIDCALAASLSAALTPAQLLPLPVLGIPQWWAANEDAAFYNNAQVFRPLPAVFDCLQTV
jgi:Protein of unknown function (DUF3025)